MIDNDSGYLPDFMVATTGKFHEIIVAKNIDDHLGSMICMDCGYTDYGWWEELTRKGVYFMTRLKSMPFMMKLDGEREDDQKHRE